MCQASFTGEKFKLLAYMTAQVESLIIFLGYKCLIIRYHIYLAIRKGFIKGIKYAHHTIVVEQYNKDWQNSKQIKLN